MLKPPILRISISRFMTLNRWVTVVNSICVLGFLFLTRLPKAVALLMIVGWILTILASVIWGLWVFLGRVEILCSRCGSSGTIQPGVGFKCLKCGYSRS